MRLGDSFNGVGTVFSSAVYLPSLTQPGLLGKYSKCILNE